MAYDEQLANRIRDVLRGEWGVTEKRMFGGLAFLIGGNMAVCAISLDPRSESRIEVQRGGKRNLSSLSFHHGMGMLRSA